MEEQQLQQHLQELQLEEGRLEDRLAGQQQLRRAAASQHSARSAQDQARAATLAADLLLTVQAAAGTEAGAARTRPGAAYTQVSGVSTGSDDALTVGSGVEQWRGSPLLAVHVDRLPNRPTGPPTRSSYDSAGPPDRAMRDRQTQRAANAHKKGRAAKGGGATQASVRILAPSHSEAADSTPIEREIDALSARIRARLGRVV
jgi:hypothetical protein